MGATERIGVEAAGRIETIVKASVADRSSASRTDWSRYALAYFDITGSLRRYDRNHYRVDVYKLWLFTLDV
jgi:hypothetical protein